MPEVLTSTPEKNKLDQIAAALPRPNPKQLEDPEGETDSDVGTDALDVEERAGLLNDPMLPEYFPAQQPRSRKGTSSSTPRESGETQSPTATSLRL